MEALKPSTETLAADSPQILKSCLEETNDDLGKRVSGNDGKESFNGGMEGVSVVVTKKVVETEVSVEEVTQMEAQKVLEDQEMDLFEGKKENREGLEESLFGSERTDENDVQENDSDDMEKVESSRDNGTVPLSDENVNDGESAFRDENDYKVENAEKFTGIRASASDEEEDEDEDEEQDHDFIEGDFVWGKIRSYPWWPGQIYAPSDASDYAANVKHKGQLLVAYFGDGSFSWCSPSQLVPYVENFEEMSNQSTSKNFLNSVQKSLDEIGRLVRLEMTCKCIAVEEPKEEIKAMNGGIKPGAVAPKGNTVKLLIHQMEPVELLSKLRYAAFDVSVISMLELTVMKSWLAAFYLANGGYSLPVYHEPKFIEGLEEKMRGGMVDKSEDSKALVDPTTQGPPEEEWHCSSPRYQPSLKKCSETNLSRTRKQKSVAELLGEEKPDMSKEAKVSSGKANDNGDGGEEGRKRGRKRKEEEVFKSPKSAENGAIGGGRKIHRTRKERKFSREESIGEETAVSKQHKEEEEETTENNFVSRERKKSKYLSPPYTSPRWSSGSGKSNGGSETEVEKLRKRARMGERMTKLAGQLIESPSPMLSKKMKVGKEDDKNISESAGLVIDPAIKVKKLVNKLLLLARDPCSLEDDRNVEKIRGFVCFFRNSVFKEGSNYQKGPRGRKGKEVNRIETETEQAKLPEKKQSSVLLHLSFPPGVALPSKGELINMFNKFGEVKESETEMLYNSFGARIVFVNSSDAEAAYRASIERNPFGGAKVTFKLLELPATKKASKQHLRKSSCDQGEEEESGVGFIKEKLEMLNTLVKNCDGKMPDELKVQLKGGMKDVLDKVSSMD